MCANLSRLNRQYPGKAESAPLCWILSMNRMRFSGAFQPYYQTAELADVTDPDKVFELFELFELFEKLRVSGIFTWPEVEQFCEAFLTKSTSNAAISNICKPAVDCWQKRYSSAIEAFSPRKCSSAPRKPRMRC